MSDIVVMVGEVRRTRLPELEIDEFDERSTTLFFLGSAEAFIRGSYPCFTI